MRNVVAKELLGMARELLSYDFPSQDALDKYMKQHPKGKRENHRVVEGKPSKGQPEPSTEPSKSKPEESKGSKKFTIPKHKMIDVQGEGDLSNMKKWKVKVQVGNSVGKNGAKKGEYDEVGYVAINTDGDDVIPIARGDEHQAGFEYLYKLQDAGVIKSTGSYITLFWGNNYPMYATNDVGRYARACKRYRELGGENTPVVSEHCITDMDEYIELKGQVPKKVEKPMKPAREVLDGMDLTARGLQARDSGVFKEAGKMLDTLDRFSYYMLNDLDTYKPALEAGKKAVESKDFDGLKKAVRVLQGEVAKQVTAEDTSFNHSDELFGTDGSAKKRVEAWSRGGAAKPKGETKPDSESAGKKELSKAGKQTVDLFEDAAKAYVKSVTSNRDDEFLEKSEILLQHLKDSAAFLPPFVEKKIDAAIEGCDKKDSSVVYDKLFSYDGVKNLIHNGLKDRKYAGKEQDDFFGHVDTAIEEFNRLGQI